MFLMSNVEAMSTYLDFKLVDRKFNESLAKLSSGYKAPTPNMGSEWVVGNDMEALYREYTIAAEHVQNARGLLEVVQQTMIEINDIMLRMDELAHRAASEEINNDQRIEMNEEFGALRSNIISLIAEVRYNDISLFSNFSLGKSFSIMIGRSQFMVVSTYSMGPGPLGISGVFLGSTVTTARSAIVYMKSAIVNINMMMARMGGQVRQIDAKVNIIDEQAMQQKGMQSRTRELDYAQEMKNFTSLQVVLQAANAMLAQANTKPQMILQLFGAGGM
jgi:flagellin